MTQTQTYAGQDLEALADIPNYQQWILRHFAPFLRGRVLEIGAGTGNFARLYIDRVDEAVLLEPATNLTSRLRERASATPRAKVVAMPLDQACAAGEVHGPFDAVVLINVLEHVDDDRRMLAQIHDLLTSDGKLLLFVPALPWLFGSLDEMLEHRRRYTLPALRSLVEDAGFRVPTIRYFDALGVLPWWVAGRVLMQRSFNPQAAQLYDRVGVPFGSIAERIISPPLGKNVLCIATRS